MMRRTYGLAVAAALVLAIGSITVAFASSGGGSADHRVQVIRLVAKGLAEGFQRKAGAAEREL